MQKKFGYHYTSAENWERIRKITKSLTVYSIQRTEGFERYFPMGVQGIWIWTRNPKGLSHMGNIVYQMSSKGSHVIVKLRVAYKESDVLRVDGSRVHLVHEGSVGKLKYHMGDPSIICTENIRLSNITVIGVYDAAKLLR